MLEYKSPSTLETPEIFTYLIEDPDPNGPYGAKEVGQGPLLPVIPAVANAIFDAVGIRVDETPIHPDKVLAAMATKDKRYGPSEIPQVDLPPTMIVPTPDEGGDGAAISGERRKSR
jgi:hypothetical protein